MRAADADILILPGLGGGGPDHWLMRWENKLSTARRVTQLEWDRADRAQWTKRIADEITQSERPVVCVAHSTGVIALLHAAETVGDRIAGAFLVAPSSETVALAIAGIDDAFIPYPRRPLPFPAILVASENDPYADIDFSKALARDLGAEFVSAGAAGHINVESGHGPWPEGSIRFAAFVAKLCASTSPRMRGEVERSEGEGLGA
jgi:predicted alpha/beta hydrolase family esterase